MCYHTCKVILAALDGVIQPGMDCFIL